MKFWPGAASRGFGQLDGTPQLLLRLITGSSAASVVKGCAPISGPVLLFGFKAVILCLFPTHVVGTAQCAVSVRKVKPDFGAGVVELFRLQVSSKGVLVVPTGAQGSPERQLRPDRVWTERYRLPGVLERFVRFSFDDVAEA